MNSLVGDKVQVFSGAPLSLQLPVMAARRFMLLIVAGFFAFLLWSSQCELDKVTRGDGRVLAAVQNQIVQHLEGGIITDIFVKEGQKIKSGDILMKINNQLMDADLSNARTDVAARRITLARMEAEMRRDSHLSLPKDLVEQAPDIAAAEETIFLSRQSQLRQQYAILDDQARGLEADLHSSQSRLASLREEESLITKQLSSLEKALAAEAVSEHDVLEKKTTLQQLRTRISEAINSIPKTRAELAEVASRRQEVWTRFASETKEKMAQIGLEMEKGSHSLGAFQDRQKREELRAPMGGTINKIYVQTIGGVVRSGEPLIEIVPDDHNIIVEAKLAPKDRGQIWPGLPATVKISAYDYSVYGGLPGKVVDISADSLQEQNGKTYYRVRLEADTTPFGKSKPVVPGMTTEVDIKSGKHTVLQYLLEPVSGLREKAFRE